MNKNHLYRVLGLESESLEPHLKKAFELFTNRLITLHYIEVDSEQKRGDYYIQPTNKNKLTKAEYNAYLYFARGVKFAHMI